METTLREETLDYIKRISRGASAELPTNTTNTEKKKMIGYISQRIEELKVDANPMIEENLLNLLRELQSSLANKKDESIIDLLVKGMLPEGFDILSTNSKINRLTRLKMIIEYRSGEEMSSERKNYERAIETIEDELLNL
ncbi:hypothetical protein [uncultured Clostridium sp.]|uniref:hypothetical protein n=1 Tax=uncultured Clostridium sp. TaxID=59620 RepID=UPI00261524CC|nr:hypothetical protein [uncultured Clostridium sp.]